VNALLNAAWKAPCKHASDKLVLVRLADRANRNGKCWMMIKNIAAETVLSVRTVKAVLPRLESKGYITVTRKDGCRNYYLVHPDLGALTGAAIAPVQKLHQTGAAIAPVVVQPLHHHPNRKGTNGEPGGSSPKSKRQMWQLLQDEKSVKERMSIERDKAPPDRKLIEALKGELQKIRSEMKGEPA
jgi:hypothetical protein